MNVRCPSCQTVFRVDPARIPAAGIRARCSRCGNGFHIDSAAAAPQPVAEAPVASPVAAPTPPPAPPAAAPPAPAPAPAAPSMAPAAPPVQAQAPMAPPAPPPAPAPPPPAPAPAPAAAAATPPRTPVFGSRDPNARAQRIARALVSDIVAYNKKKVDETLSNGTMRTEFREEIMKSWEEYVAQVGQELAKSTPFFRNALNEILARGQQVF